MKEAADKLSEFRDLFQRIKSRAKGAEKSDPNTIHFLQKQFSEQMNQDFDVPAAFETLHRFLVENSSSEISPPIAAGIVQAIQSANRVLQIVEP
jgi:cysteinyl-tRNA synthetase